MPYVHRAFRRPEGDGVRSGSVRGLGDVAVLVHGRPWLRIAADRVAAITVLGGVKLATGDGQRIGEELLQDEEASGDAAPASGIHGHDLALGTGSTDGILGVSDFFRDRRLVANAAVQYTVRRHGDFDYRYANDLTWSFAPAAYLSLSHENTLTAGAVLSGEHKGEDTLARARADDTAIDAVYLGPQITYSRGSGLYAEAAADFPLRQQTSGLQAVPDYRVRLAVTWRP